MHMLSLARWTLNNSRRGELQKDSLRPKERPGREQFAAPVSGVVL